MATTRTRKSSRKTSKQKAPHILVLRAPGTNCDRETAFAFESVGATTSAVHINALLAKPKLLSQAQGLVIPGGFSYGDDLGAGTVLGTTLRTRLRDPLRALVDRGGIVLGICNGFQVLVKTGLLPGFADGKEGSLRLTSLASNRQNRYEDRWVTLRATTSHCVFLKEGDEIHCPVAHAEGRLVIQDEATRKRLHKEGHVALQYVGPKGRGPVPFPFNPNGSIDDIAGLTDATGRVLGLMPHPERNQFVWQDPRFHAGTAPRKPEGLLPFRNAIRHLEKTFS
jgi:phosphoribosylformylglycinamidine synthase